MTFYLLYFYMPDWNKYLLFMLFIPTCVLLILAIFFKI